MIKRALLGGVIAVGAIGYWWFGPSGGKVGRFLTRPEKLETVDDSEYMVLKEDISFIDPHGTTWLAPAGTKTDGATIPQFFLSFIGDRFDPKYRAAALIHDAYCQEINKGGASYHKATWEKVHEMFFDACVAGGTGEREAQMMFAAVWIRGPRWTMAALDGPGSASSQASTQEVAGVPDSLQKEEFEKCRKWLEAKPRTNAELIDWMTKREQTLREQSPPDPALENRVLTPEPPRAPGNAAP